MFDTLEEAYQCFKTIFDKKKINIYILGKNFLWNSNNLSYWKRGRNYYSICKKRYG